MIRRSLLLLSTMAAALGAVSLPAINSAEVCGNCHRAIHQAWKRSAHARAMESRMFQDALAESEAQLGPNTRQLCLRCHVPLAIELGDLALARKTSWEGVTCDYCHAIHSVEVTAGGVVARTRFSQVKFGPIRDAASTAHGTAFSGVHAQAEICAPCHEHRNQLGFPVLTTYSEWKVSRYAEKATTCQHCHMGKVAGDVVEPRIKRTASAEVNLHEMPGSHSVTQLNRAVRGSLDVARQGDQLEITVRVQNVGAGHWMPTGSPMRKLVLELAVDPYQGKPFREKREYARVVADEQGQPIQREYMAFVRASKVLADSRLRPGETRVEKFSVPVAASVPAQVKAVLLYLYSPTASGERERVEIHTLSRFVPGVQAVAEGRR